MSSSFWQAIILMVTVLGSGIGLAYTHHTNRQLFIQWQIQENTNRQQQKAKIDP